MKHKYLIQKNHENNQLYIKEFAELDKEVFSLLCQEAYPLASIAPAIAKGKEALIATLRTKNMYPIATYAEKIAETVINLFESENDDTDAREIFFDDIELLKKSHKTIAALKDIDDESVEIDDLLDTDAADSDFDDITYPIKIADDDPPDTEDED